MEPSSPQFPSVRYAAEHLVKNRVETAESEESSEEGLQLPFTEIQISFSSLLRTLLPELVKIIEPDFGLLEELQSMRILDEMQIADVRGGMNVYEQNNRLLHHFTNKSDDVCQPFLNALTNTQQHHVANYVNGAKRNGYALPGNMLYCCRSTKQ